MKLVFLFLLSTLAVAAADIRVVVWDEQQPRQEATYENFLSNAIANHLKTQPGLKVCSVRQDDPNKGIGAGVLGNCDVLIWWGHVRQFPDHGFDGMRCDADGNLCITRYGKGTVAVLSSEGEVLREINVLGARPSNLCFGGPDGRTVYVTEVEHQRLVQFRVETAGAVWTRWER